VKIIIVITYADVQCMKETCLLQKMIVPVLSPCFSDTNKYSTHANISQSRKTNLLT